MLVVGGGVNGAGIARDAAGRGLRVCLIEQHDLASGTSSASTKLIHGGLRYLEYGAIGLVREALRERERLLAIAPHIVRPLRFVLPYTRGLRARWEIRLGLLAYDHLAGRRRLAPSRAVDLTRDPAGAALEPRFTRGFRYSDCRVDDSRLVVLNALDAHERGGRILTHTRLERAHADAHGWRVECSDLATAKRLTIRARVLVNAAGCWVERVRRAAGLPDDHRLRLIKGSHIVVPQLFAGEEAYLLQNPDRRVVFAIPYEQDWTLIGTTDIPYDGDLAQVTVDDAEIEYLCTSVNRFFKRRVAPSDVRWRYAGVRPLYNQGGSSAQSATREYDLELEHPPGGGPLLTVIGGKISTYRSLAEAALRKLHRSLAHANAPWTARAALPGGDVPSGDIDRFCDSARERWPFLSRSLASRLAHAYGTRMEQILGRATTLAALGEHFGAGLTAAEVNYLRTHEWAVTAQDILWRRSKLGLRITADATARLEQFLNAPRRVADAQTAP